MLRMFFALLAVAAVFCPAGCGDNYVPAPRPSSPGEMDEPSPPPAESPNGAKESPVAEPKHRSAKPHEDEPRGAKPHTDEPFAVEVQPVAPIRYSIELNRGVALGQPGPEGTMMMFSVEYEFIVGGPDNPPNYVWVIERAKGGSVKQPVSLKNSGELNAAISGWRPDEGPFRSHIENSEGKRLSANIEMR